MRVQSGDKGPTRFIIDAECDFVHQLSLMNHGRWSEGSF